MSYEIIGEIIKISEIETFASGFQKRSIVVKTIENYPQEILIEFMKDRVDLPDAHTLGSVVTVGININGRMWESPSGEKKWFNSLIGWKIIKDTASAPENEPTQAKPSEYKAPEPAKFEEDEDDGLPF